MAGVALSVRAAAVPVQAGSSAEQSQKDCEANELSFVPNSLLRKREVFRVVSWPGAGALHPIGLDLISSTSAPAYPHECRGAGRGYWSGAVAQLGERLICIQEVAGSIPTSSTS